MFVIAQHRREVQAMEDAKDGPLEHRRHGLESDALLDLVAKPSCGGCR